MDKYYEFLRDILDIPHIYIQPPPNHRIEYPCLIVELDKREVTMADGSVYILDNRYQLTYITRDVADKTYKNILDLPFTTYKARFVNDGLYHETYESYFKE